MTEQEPRTICDEERDRMKMLGIEDDTDKFETIRNFPEWAGSYILFGKDDSLSKEEISMINNWIQSEGISEIYLAYPLNEVFSPHPVFGSACDVVPVNIKRTACITA